MQEKDLLFVKYMILYKKGGDEGVPNKNIA